ncbi:MAG: HAD family hydrolase [Verrucomicrobiota bacterium]
MNENSPAHKSGARRPQKAAKVWLQAPGWRDETRRALTELIRRGSGKRLPVTLDFDNTIVWGDIGEATLAVLVKNGALSARRIPRTLSPSFRLPQGESVALDSGPDLTAYYEAYLAPTAHGSADPTPLANGYAWVVEIMEGLSPWEVVQATKEAYGFGEPMQPRMIEVTAGKTRFPAPFFYPEMVELIGELRRHEFDVWVISASNVWSVRWMVTKALNPLLAAHGAVSGIPADHVVGISALLQDKAGGLYKDALLVRENQAYAALEESALRSFRLTSRLQYPVPTYAGKVGCIWDAIGHRPYLAAGDSPGDHAMLSFSEHRLWIMRLDKPGYQQKTADCIQRTGKKGWLIQPVIGREARGFRTSFDAPPGAASPLRTAIRQSNRLLRSEISCGE